MKRAEFYVNAKQEGASEYPKVSGYIEDVTDSEGNVFTIGYDKRGSWIATELKTGCMCSVGRFDNREKCAEWVHNNIDIIVDVMYRKLHNDKLGAISIQQFRDFINSL